MQSILFQYEDETVIWEHHNGDNICTRFSIEDWGKIVSDIHTNKEWVSLVEEYSDLIECYILKRRCDNHEIGFIYLYHESVLTNIVSIHGGGWEKSMISSILYYRGLILMIRNLLSQGFRVRTSCFISNEKAYRFLKIIGFVVFKTSDKSHYMWINQRRLLTGRIYKYLYKNSQLSSLNA